MNSTERALLAQRWSLLQLEILPCFNDELGILTPKLEKVIHILELTRIEEFVRSCRYGAGRPLPERAWIANAFVAKSVLNITNTRALIDRLQNDRSLRRICGFPLTRKLPSESTFSRAFGEFAEQGLAERVHETLVKTYLGQELVGHLSRDSTAIEARERPVAPEQPKKKKRSTQTRIQRQREQSLQQAPDEIPTQCNR